MTGRIASLSTRRWDTWSSRRCAGRVCNVRRRCGSKRADRARCSSRGRYRKWGGSWVRRPARPSCRRRRPRHRPPCPSSPSPSSTSASLGHPEPERPLIARAREPRHAPSALLHDTAPCPMLAYPSAAENGCGLSGCCARVTYREATWTISLGVHDEMMKRNTADAKSIRIMFTPRRRVGSVPQRAPTREGGLSVAARSTRHSDVARAPAAISLCVSAQLTITPSTDVTTGRNTCHPFLTLHPLNTNTYTYFIYI